MHTQDRDGISVAIVEKRFYGPDAQPEKSPDPFCIVWPQAGQGRSVVSAKTTVREARRIKHSKAISLNRLRTWSPIDYFKLERTPLTSATNQNQADSVKLFFGVVAVALATILCLQFSRELLGDPDTHWHIAVGRDILTKWAFPTVDEYSHTHQGQPWIAKEWLSQIILYLAYGLGGWWGVATTAAASFGLAAGLMYFRITQFVRPQLALVATLLGFLISCGSFVARPHALALPLAILWTIKLFGAAERLESPRFWWLLILVLWSNLHAAFAVGYAVAGIAFILFLENGKCQDKPAVLRWLAFLALCIPATIIHPYGWKPIEIALKMAQANDVMDIIVEWQPFNAQEQRGQHFCLLILLGGLLWSRIKLGVARTLFIVMTLHMFLTHVRFVYMCFIFIPLVVAPLFAARFHGTAIKPWRDVKRDAIEAFIARNLKLLIPIPVLAVAFLLGKNFYVALAPEERVSISSAIHFAKSMPHTGNVLNFYNFGGPLILSGIPTYIDGRAEQLFLQGFSDIEQGSRECVREKIVRAAIEKYNVTWTLLAPGDPRNNFIRDTLGWEQVYRDDFALILVKPETKEPP